MNIVRILIHQDPVDSFEEKVCKTCNVEKCKGLQANLELEVGEESRKLTCTQKHTQHEKELLAIKEGKGQAWSVRLQAINEVAAHKEV